MEKNWTVWLEGGGEWYADGACHPEQVNQKCGLPSLIEFRAFVHRDANGERATQVGKPGGAAENTFGVYRGRLPFRGTELSSVFGGS